jgi:4-hydroxy-tetrahydrodipicolinate synthase
MKFRSDPSQIRGSIAALCTPFTESGELDHDSLRSLVRWQLVEESHGICIGGTTSEPSSQTIDERTAAMRTVVEEVNESVPFVAGAGSDKLETTIALTDAAFSLGADAAMIATPHYSHPTQEGLFSWYSTVCNEFPDFPIIAYNIPQRSAVDMAPETVARLRREHPNLVGLKESSEDLYQFTELFSLCGRDFLVWTGAESHCLPLLALGTAGFIGALANVAPRAVRDMYDLGMAGDREAALDLHLLLHPLVKLLFVETNPSPSKYVLARWRKISSERVRPPLSSLTSGGRARTRALLEEARALVDPETGVMRMRGAAVAA